MSYKLADTKKYYYFSLSSLPYSVLSLGYKTDVINSAFYFSSIAIII